MTSLLISPQEAAAELLRRRRARNSLSEFAQAIDIPGRPISLDEHEWLFHPVELKLAAHHFLLMNALEKVFNREVLNLMVFMPPGSAKSTYTSVTYPSYAMGKRPGSRFILGSYASGIAWKQSRRCRQIVGSSKYRGVFGTGLVAGNASVEEWALENGSEYMAGGILAGMTGNRATDLIIDDPVAGREEADSPTIRKKTREAYEDDLSTRLLPGGSTIIVQTRWHQDDLSGCILPKDWAGESGILRGRDGRDWLVVCLPAICDRKDDPLHREIGDPLWPEWFSSEHFAKFQGNQRTWSALFQQRPTPETGDYFKREWFQRYETPPKHLQIYAASDYAVTVDDGDWTEHGIFGVDPEDNIYILDWWYGQTDASEWIESMLDMVKRHKPIIWFGEAGVIRRSIEPFLKKSMQQRRTYQRVDWLASISDKPTRARSFQAIASQGKVFLPMTPWAERLLSQLLRFPAGAEDDGVDVCSLLGRGLDKTRAPKEPSDVKPGPKYGTLDWLLKYSGDEKKRSKYRS